LAGEHEQPTAPGLRAGTRVEVRSGFDDQWQRGFVIDEVTEAGYRLRRDTDGALLPEIPHDRIRRERRRQTWWI
jgi:hypothetical protein